MRPETLELKNFGPFCGEHRADFASLGDFFLICGETGAGKTTLFDAISYAFYGEAPGSRKGLAKQLKSQYAKDGDESFVRLTFSIGNGRWRIKRTLPSEKISERTKKIKTVPEEVSLEREAGGAWAAETLGGKKETDSKILSLVKLSADEFSRIVLLPQGEFSNFLKQNSEERKEILDKLFPVEIYSNAAEKIKEKSKLAETAAADAKARKDALLAEFNPQSFGEEKQRLDEKVAALEKDGKSLQQKILELSHLLEKAKRIAEKRERLKAAESAYQKEIAEREEESAGWQEKLNAANRAAPVAGFIGAHKAAQADLAEARAKREQSAARLEETQKAISLLEADRKKAEGADGEIARLVQQKTLIEGAVDAAREFEKSAGEIKALESESGAKRKGLDALAAEIAQAEAAIKEKEGECAPDVLMRLAQEKAAAERERELTAEKALRTEKHIKQRANLNELQEKQKFAKEDIAKKEANLKEAEEELEQARRDLTAEKERQMAAALASSLEEGAPCPVCGSVHHPAPAVTSGASLEALELAVKAAELKMAEASGALQAARVNAGKAEGELATLSSQIESAKNEGNVFSDSEEAKAALSVSKANAESAAQALERANRILKESSKLKEKRESLRKQSEKIEKALQEAAQALAVLRERNGKALARFREVFDGATPNRAAAEKALAECEAERAGLEQFVKGFREKDNKLRHERSALEGSTSELANNVESLAAKAESAKAKLKEECSAAGFATHEEAERACLPQEEKAALGEKIESFNSRKAELENQMRVFRQDLAAETAEAPQDMDGEKLKAEYEALNLSAQENQRLRDEAVLCLSELERNRKSWEELEEECAKKEEEAGSLSSLSSDLHGGNSLKIKFEAWILRQYLEEITEYANIRIDRLSGGRYRLRCDSTFRKGNAKTGLDLEIFDSYTGKTRPVGTLSGGEMFMASISLALGLADSIQSRAGGIQLEAVFIDEGFGSLDDDCIELAMDILDEIRGQRMVGIISHVRELKERIPKKLEVKKKPSGGSYIKQCFE